MSTTPCEYTTECLIVGGGPAGYGAAMAALDGGCPVIVAERHGFLGGMGSAAGLGCFINYHFRGEDLADSVYHALIRQMMADGTCYHGDGDHVDMFDPEALKHVMEKNILRRGGRLLYHTLLRSLRRESDGFWRADFSAKGATVTIRARQVIDATGDADACALAGAEMTHGRRADGKTQPMTMVVQIGGFDPAAWQRAGHQLVHGLYAGKGDCFAEEIEIARAAGEWDIPRIHISIVWAMPGDPTRILVNGTRVQGFSSCNPEEFTLAEIEGRRQAVQMTAFFKKYVAGFANAFLLSTGPQIGVRESRRIVGRATLTEHDVWSSSMPADTVARCAYPIDLHQPNGNGTHLESSTADYLYGIPYACLLPRGLSGIAAAGRCISATHEAAGSFRVMPTCMSLGQAAGTAAAMARENGCAFEDINGGDIRERMLAIVPACV
ncbi:FAD-dependent pyridine nucleotide-disulfide oxidoreductase [Opitutaceae bacterium TAV5]|nr:FAD-dependent pyridine nucleotide-disulfide oxidoreductase [Opitutaceae bacterium TAV5]